MTLHQLRIFSTVARHLNVTRAANELHLSQPSASEQIKFLEDELDFKLYRKIGRGIDLTGRGRAFLAEINPVLGQMEVIKKKFGKQKIHGTTLTVGGADGPAAFLLPSLAAVFRKSHPQTKVALRGGSSSALEQMVRNSDIELAVITNRSDLPYLAYERCRREEAVLFTSSGAQWNQRRITRAGLGEVPLVVFKRGQVGGMAQILNQIREKVSGLNIVMHCELAEAVKNAVKARIGVGLLYKDLLRSEIERGEVKVIRIPGLKMCVESFIIYHKEKPLSADARNFLALLQRSRDIFISRPPDNRPYLYRNALREYSI
jgi:DNA-binding transcriptional LysR family regulator